MMYYELLCKYVLVNLTLGRTLRVSHIVLCHDYIIIYSMFIYFITKIIFIIYTMLEICYIKIFFCVTFGVPWYLAYKLINKNFE
jgi:hypothetical protein